MLKEARMNWLDATYATFKQMPYAKFLMLAT